MYTWPYDYDCAYAYNKNGVLLHSYGRPELMTPWFMLATHERIAYVVKVRMKK
jgi:hypothetical protein